MPTLGPPRQVNDAFSYTVTPDLGGYGGTLDGVGQGDKVVAISADGTSYVAVDPNNTDPSQESTVSGEHLSFGALASGGVDTDPIGDAQSLIDRINANDGQADPLQDKFYYKVENAAGQTTDTLTYSLNDIALSAGQGAPFTSPETLDPDETVSVAGLSTNKALSTGASADTADDQIYSVTVSSFDFDKQASEGTFSIIEGEYTPEQVSYNADQTSVTITERQSQINDFLQHLYYTAADDAGKNAILFSAVAGNEATPTFIVGELDVVCFCTGTRILTVRGEVAVEDLRAGDLAVTASGERRPVRWIGHRALGGAGAPLPVAQRPVRVLAGAFGPGVPARDLLLSPGHPVLVGADADGEGGHLVPVMCLVNGTTVEREVCSAVTYWHVELDRHDILLAEGLPAESYLDWGDRPFFTEGADHALLNPDHVVPGLSARCRPVALDGPVVEAERRRLDAVFAQGLASACAWPSADDASLGF